MTPLDPLSLYFLRVRAFEASTYDSPITRVVISIGHFTSDAQLERRRLTFELPISKPLAQALEEHGQWCERYIFVRPEAVENGLEIHTDPAHAGSLEFSIKRVLVETGDLQWWYEQADHLGEMTFELDGVKYPHFLGVEDLVAYLDHMNSIGEGGQQKLPSLLPTNSARSRSDELWLAIGDPFFIDWLRSSRAVITLEDGGLPALESGLIDGVALQRHAPCLADGMTFGGEREAIERLLSSFHVDGPPVYQFDTNDGATFTPKALCQNSGSPVCSNVHPFEAEPLRGDHWSSQNVLVPAAADIYNDPRFEAATQMIADAGFHVIIADVTYDHVPQRLLERFKAGRITAFGRVSFTDFVSLANQSALVVLPEATLRPESHAALIAKTAWQAGAIPIRLGLWREKERSPYDPVMIPDAPSLREYLVRHSDPLVREREWLASFRDCMREHRESMAERVQDGGGGPLTAEIICVSKRPENAERIFQNLRRQDYPELRMHLVWNVDIDSIPYEREALLKSPDSAIRVSIVGEEYNIGACLNYAIRECSSDVWFKVDDDDYYGRNYIEDAINIYHATGADVVGKPAGLMYLEDSDKHILRPQAIHRMRRYLQRDWYLVGATLSAKVVSSVPLFSVASRNSCDSEWVNRVRRSGLRIVVSDSFNFYVWRGGQQTHTWRPDLKALVDRSGSLERVSEEWIDAI